MAITSLTLQIWSQDVVYTGCSLLRCGQLLLQLLAVVQSLFGWSLRPRRCLIRSILSSIYNE